MRASDADRDQVLDVLRAAAGDGRLTVDELDERLGAALASRTLGELAGLTADLVAPSAPLASPTTVAPPAPLASPVTHDPRPEHVIRIDQRGGSVQRAGRWVVPRRLELRLSWCDAKLDFTDAVIRRDELLIDMNMRGGSLVLVTRPGIVTDAYSLRVRYTDVMITPDAAPSTPRILTVQLAGRMRYGWIETRRPGQPPHSWLP
jgi:hypothetical protein